MDGSRFGHRVDVMEQRMDAWETRFDAAVGSLTAQISQLGEQIGSELPAIRGEIRAGDEALREELSEAIRAADEALRQEMRAGHEVVRGEFADLRADMHIGADETRHLMRVLHEDVIERIARLGEDR
jgi:hypothetical protein